MDLPGSSVLVVEVGLTQFERDILSTPAGQKLRNRWPNAFQTHHSRNRRDPAMSPMAIMVMGPRDHRGLLAVQRSPGGFTMVYYGLLMIFCNSFLMSQDFALSSSCNKRSPIGNLFPKSGKFRESPRQGLGCSDASLAFSEVLSDTYSNGGDERWQC